MEELLTEGAGVDIGDSVVVFFNLSIGFPSLAALFAEVGARVMSGKERTKNGKFVNNMKFLVKVFFTM